MLIFRRLDLTLAALAFSATAASAGVCPDGAVAALDTLPADVMADLETAVGVPFAELAQAHGAVTMTELTLSDTTATYCVDFNTSMTCSNGIAVCAIGVVAPAQHPSVLLMEAAHGLTTTQGDDWAGITLSVDRADGVTTSLYDYCDGIYAERCTSPTEASTNG